MLAGLVEEPQQDELPIDQLSDRAQVDSLPDLNVLLLRGTEQDLEILGEIVEQIEKLAADRQLTFRIVPLEHVKATRLADLVDDLYSGMVNARGAVSRATQQTRVIPLAKPNAILLAAPRNDMDQLVGLIADLDQPVSPATQYRTFRLVHAAANEMSRVVRQFFSGRGADGELSVDIVVTADPRSNSLVVLAGPRDMAEVERLVADLDTPTTASVNQMRVFALQNTLASELVTVLNQAISGSATAAAAAAAGGTQIRLLRPDGENGRFVESGILENVRVTANTRSNTLIVSAPPKTLGLIEELIRQLDVAPSAVAEIKVFTLQHSDAQRMVQTLQSLFSQVQGAGGEVTLAGAPPAQTGVQLPPPTFSVDERTNSLLVSGSRSQLQVIEAIIIRLDGSDVQERTTTVYRLKNATATAVADAVGQFLQRQLLRQLQQVGIEAPTQLLERDVVVVPEPITNSLLISAAPRFFPEVQKLIEQLDEAPPQVVIQVLVAEVTLTDDEEFGIELGIQDSVLFRRGIFPGTATLAPPATPTGITINTTQPPGVPGFNFNNQPLGNNPTVGAGSLGGQGLANFGVGRTGSGGFGGMVLSASSENISLLLRALKAQSRINVLSRPQIMTTDNQEAFIQIGQKVPIVTNSVITAQGSVINPVNFQDVGIILHVTPKINPDGTVIMRVDPEISSLSQSTIEISTGTFAPVIDTIRAETTVSAQNGQTVIIGGLITSSRFKERRKVPYLGDIPILEWAFRFDQKNDRKRELLILLTPHVVRGVEEAERIKQVEAARMDWCLPEVEEVHGPIAELPASALTESPPADESGREMATERLHPIAAPSTPDSTAATQEGESYRRKRLWPFERSRH